MAGGRGDAPASGPLDRAGPGVGAAVLLGAHDQLLPPWGAAVPEARGCVDVVGVDVVGVEGAGPEAVGGEGLGLEGLGPEGLGPEGLGPALGCDVGSVAGDAAALEGLASGPGGDGSEVGSANARDTVDSASTGPTSSAAEQMPTRLRVDEEWLMPPRTSDARGDRGGARPRWRPGQR